ncbi:hypothetical protein W97_02255 [Coniosporium apollinis CBS 100218]|uniref:NTF2-like domain-containing protein n=1 Tax=Coniosporium apollinis (strain CBS 100218) TaxID=1168221 RepID=R7YMI4_CONA1|nr:uncharacterized protein W97_02255 [Coniosporium apollinis CBS 100218]EON63029.1 hypothetical protein W97_02255 [Coniosporium apollinis CBS 100218]
MMLNIKSLLFYALTLAPLILAHPQDDGKGKGGHKGKGYLTDREAYDIVQLFFSFFEAGFDPAVAERTLTEDFVEQSGGLNFPTGQNSTATTSKAQFIERQIGSTANTMTVYTALDWFHDCSNIAVHWVDNSAPAQVLGIDYLILEKDTRRIKKSFVEANIGAILFNAGFPECQGPAPA